MEKVLLTELSVNFMVIIVHILLLLLLAKTKRNNVKRSQKYFLISLYLNKLAYSIFTVVIILLPRELAIRLGYTPSRHLQDVFKTYHQVKLFLLTRLWEAFNTFLRRSFPKTIIYRGICPGNTSSDKFMVSVQNLQVR